MPIYEYQCGKCGYREEIFHKLDEQLHPSCPKCGKKMKKMISPAAFILKGSGWHVTDYPSQSRKNGMDSEVKEKDVKKEAEPKEKPAPATTSTTEKKKKTS